MPESDQHLAADGGASGLGGVEGATSGSDIDMGEVLLSDDMSFDAIAAEIRRTMTKTGSVLGRFIEQKEKSALD